MASTELTVSSGGKVREDEGDSSHVGHQEEGLLRLQGTVVEFTSDATQPHAPPSYDEAMDPSSAPPPSYDSLYGRVREVHKESSGNVDFIKNVFLLLIGTIGCTIFVAISICIPLCMFIIGVVYVHDCPANKYIPIYLIVGGIFGVLKQIMSLCERVQKSGDNRDEEQSIKKSSFQNLVGCFMLIWFICGNYWIYSLYKPSHMSSSPNYCAKVCYWFAFWQMTLVYIMLGFSICCFCLTSVCLVLFMKRQDMTPVNES